MKKLGLALLLSTAVFSAWGMEYNPEDNQVAATISECSEQEVIVAVVTKGGKKVPLLRPCSRMEYNFVQLGYTYVETEESIKWREQQYNKGIHSDQDDPPKYRVGQLTFMNFPLNKNYPYEEE